MAVERIQPEGLPSPPHYSQVVKAGNTIYLAGQVSVNASGEIVGAGDFVAQATQVYENMKTALAAAGAGFGDLVKITTYLTDPRYRDPLREVRSKYIGNGPVPASTMVMVAGLAQPEWLIEIEGIAVIE